MAFLIPVAVVAATAYSIYSAQSAKKPKVPELATPSSPTPDSAIKEEEKKRLVGRGTKGTLLTGPQGLLQPAEVKHKVLLGGD
jgi:hypothetical protein